MTVGREWNAANVQSSFWRFYRNDANGAAIILPTGECPLEASRLYFVPAGTRFTCHNAGELEHFYIHFDVIGLRGPGGRGWFTAPIVLPRDRFLEGTVASLAVDGALDDFAGHCRVKSLLYGALALAFECCPFPAGKHQLEQEWTPLQSALDYVEDHLNDPLNNALLASLCCVSEDYFIRRFRVCVGQTPNLYVQERRVQRAAQLLLFSQDSIESIAERTGFGSRTYFCRQFARHTGVSPAAYRKSKRI